MLQLAVFEDLAELRDAVLILAGIGACVVALVFLTVRRLEQFHERRIAAGVVHADAQLAAWLKEDRWSPRGMLELLRLAAGKVQQRRTPPPKKRRLFGLLPPA